MVQPTERFNVAIRPSGGDDQFRQLKVCSGIYGQAGVLHSLDFDKMLGRLNEEAIAAVGGPEGLMCPNDVHGGSGLFGERSPHEVAPSLSDICLQGIGEAHALNQHVLSLLAA
ncbi:hypothetical protein [Nocardioides sp. B-3]|uniref:hypothetical protein n=1 Tax=Nocardioides sp. B-3 TaxID=2895565 RepID=UPI0021525E95|nr:hypothetical protein [Nocardioides sp. B-3]UUZ59315.1 hypothetical protein LP418_26245 [Nocardioides sp. B-3]